MHARNPRNNTPIVATLERVYGRTKLVRDGFSKNDGVVDREIQGPTEMLWHTSETIGYLDANNEEVDWDGIELYDPASGPEGSAGDEAAPGDVDAAPEQMQDPAARAGNTTTAARAVERIVAEMNAQRHEAATAAGGTHDTGTKAGLKAFDTEASARVDGIDVRSSLSSPAALTDAPRLTQHAHEAVIHLKGKHPVQIHCFRKGNRFVVIQVTAIEEGHLSRVAPTPESTTQLELYANTILNAWGL